MTEAELVKLYNEFVDCCKQPNQPNCRQDEDAPKKRYARYEEIKAEVELMRKDLNKGEVIDKVDHEDFLEVLFHKQQNGVAKAGTWGYARTFKEFQDLINDTKLLKSLEEVIKNPCGNTGEDLLNCIVEVREFNNERSKKLKLLVNRIIAASTEDTSSTVDVEDFFYFFKKFQNRVTKNKIKKYHGTDDKSRIVTTWYEKNVHVITELRIIIQNAINTKPDPIVLSKLPWLWIEKHPNPNK